VSEATAEIWILGATGRTGRDIARLLAAQGLPLALVGRDGSRLRAAADGLPDGARVVVAPDLPAMADAIRRERPAVVVNTVGPFARTATPILRASLPASSYLDLANDAVAAEAVLALHDEAERAGRTIVTGAGFGVVATEAPIAALMADRPAPHAVRVDAIASLATEAGALGEALAATIVEGVPEGGRRIAGGRLVRAGVGSAPLRLTLPDGDVVTSGAWPAGDLLAAARTSGAQEVVAATNAVPTGRAIRAVLPLAGPLLRLRPLQRLAVRRLAAVRLPDRPRPRAHSWGHARAEWADDTVREAWLRTGDAGGFTAAVAAVVAARIARGAALPGAHTPVAAVGLDLVTEAGGELLLP
jgi:short subunit dehydrogenase-like uncharacterized protein